MTKTVISPYFQHQKRIISPFLENCKTLLDFGCGDMELDRILIDLYPKLTITGIDVAPFQIRNTPRLKFRLYTGKKLPFRDHSFDAVFAYHVFHHTENPAFSLKECLRVSRNRLVIVEPVLRFPFEKIGFAVLDWLMNIWKKEQVPLPYHVRTRAFWKREFQRLNLQNVTIRNAGVLPRFLPIGETLLFVLER